MTKENPLTRKIKSGKLLFLLTALLMVTSVKAQLHHSGTIPDNTLPVFNAQTRAHWSPSILPPILTWYLGRNGMGASSVTNIHLPCYTHADLFFAADAERELYAPLEGWIARASALSRGRESAASR